MCRDPPKDRKSIKQGDPAAMNLIEDFIFPDRKVVMIVCKNRETDGQVEVQCIQPAIEGFHVPLYKEQGRC